MHHTIYIYIFVVTCPTWSWYKHQVSFSTSSVWSCFSSYFIKYQATRFSKWPKDSRCCCQPKHSKAVKLRAEGRLLVFCVVPLVSFQQKILSPWFRLKCGLIWCSTWSSWHGSHISGLFEYATATNKSWPRAMDRERYESSTRGTQWTFWEIILTVIPYRFPPVWPSTTHIIIHIIPFPSRYIVVYIFVALSQHYPYFWSQDLAAETGK